MQIIQIIVVIIIDIKNYLYKMPLSSYDWNKNAHILKRIYFVNKLLV